MSDNIYDAPEAELTPEHSDVSPFFTVGIKKLVIMNILTIGIYSLYWFFRHWRHQKITQNPSIWPAPRAIFAIFFTYSLFKKIDTYAVDSEAEAEWSFKGNAWAYILILIVSSVSGNIPLFSPLLDLLLALFLPMLQTVFLVNAQKVVNLAQEKIETESNDTLTAANYAWIIVWVVLVGLGIVGTFFATL